MGKGGIVIPIAFVLIMMKADKTWNSIERDIYHVHRIVMVSLRKEEDKADNDCNELPHWTSVFNISLSYLKSTSCEAPSL